MKLILLDDEPLLRQGIKIKIMNAGIPLEVCGEAGDGAAGLELVRALDPDIVITDIRMPMVDGLEFIREALKIKGSLKFIIISGYGDFEYAKQAIQFGVSDYLLKPFDEEELHGALSKLVQIIGEERRLSSEFANLQSMEALSRETIRTQMLTRFVGQERQSHTEVTRDEWIARLQERFGLYMSVVLIIEPFQMPHGSFRAEEEGLLWFAVKNIVSVRLESAGFEGVLFQHAVQKYELVYVIGLPCPEEGTAVRVVLEEVLSGVGRLLKLGMTIGTGTEVDQMDKIQSSYQQAKQALRNMILHGTGRIYESDTARKAADRGSFLTEEDERMLFQWLNESNSSAMHRYLDARIGAIAQDQSSVYSQLEWFCVDWYLIFRKYLLSQTNQTDWLIGEMDDLLQWLQNLSCWQEAALHLKKLTDSVTGYLSSVNKTSGSDVIEQVRAYMEDHFHEPLSLQMIADRFFIHPNYFSRRFKEKFDVSFIDHLTAVRMKHAARLLLASELKVHQIAEMVGYDDPAYFSNVFRKANGVTPKQFRERQS